MKTKRFLCMLLVLVSLISCASAESIFPVLQPAATEAPQPTITAPSYGAMAGVDPTTEAQNAQGGTILTYENVMEDGYNAFGVYLNQRGFRVISQETQSDMTAYVISDGTVEFVMIYNQPNHTMNLVYPEGTAYEKPLFPGYKPLKMNEEIYVDGLGKFTFNQLVLDGAYDKVNFFVTSSDGKINWLYKYDYKLQTVYTWLRFSYYNTTTSTKCFDRYFNDLFSVTLVYINEYNRYFYNIQKDKEDKLICGRNFPNYGIFATSGRSEEYKLGNAYYTGSQKSLDGIVAFEVPASARAAQDGILALLIQFATGQKNVIMLRENGVDLYDLTQPAK